MTYGTGVTCNPGHRVSQACVHLFVMQCRYMTNVHKTEVRASPLSAKSVILTSESKMSVTVGAVCCMHNDNACCLCRQLNDNLTIVRAFT